MRRIIWSSQAEAELEEILAYFEKNNAGSNSYGVYLINKIEKISAHYLHFPEMGQRIGTGEDRFFRCDHLKLVYAIVEDGIEISTIWDARRDPDSQKIS